MNPIPFRPLYCVWELTLACNLRCGHCGSSAGRARADELSTAEALDAVRQLAELDCRLITLSGGEPTLRRDWELIAREAVGRGITVNMVTNGTTMTDELAGRVAAAGLANVAVSLDGPEAVHDDNRGPGTFRRAAKALERLGARGVPTAVLTHLDVRSAARLEEIHDLVVDLGARAFRVQLGKPMGELALHRERVLQPEDLLELLPRIARLKKRSSIWVDVGDSIGYYGPHERALRTKGWGGMRNLWTGCQAGRFAIGIESDGGIKGCLSLQADLAGSDGRDPFVEGHLRERRLADLWFDPKAFAFNRAEGLEGLTGECRACEHARLCRGGAKCVSAAFTGALGEDPYCYTRVARLQAGRSAATARRGRAAAAAVVGIGLSGCLGGCLIATEEPDPAPLAADAGQICADVCCDCEYGVPPPPECCGQVTDLDAGTAPDAGPAPDAGDPCANVCCDCDYGTSPPPECCEGPDAGTSQDAGPAPDAGDPCADVCCACEYGVEPPPECCDPADAGPAPDPCADVCCDCEYGVPPPPECCGQAADAGPAPDAGDPCANVCCDCDYGIPPPPECCDPTDGG